MTVDNWDEKNKEGQTPLHLASAKGCADAVAWLVQKSHSSASCLESTDNRAGQTPLHKAVQSKSLQAVKNLVEAGTKSYNSQDVHGDTPLHIVRPAIYFCSVYQMNF